MSEIFINIVLLVIGLSNTGILLTFVYKLGTTSEKTEASHKRLDSHHKRIKNLEVNHGSI